MSKPITTVSVFITIKQCMVSYCLKMNISLSFTFRVETFQAVADSLSSGINTWMSDASSISTSVNGYDGKYFFSIISII